MCFSCFSLFREMKNTEPVAKLHVHKIIWKFVGKLTACKFLYSGQSVKNYLTNLKIDYLEIQHLKFENNRVGLTESFHEG